MKDLSKIEKQIDSKLNKLGVPITEMTLRPCSEPFSYNKEKNSIIFNELNIKDDCNYLVPINLILQELDPSKTLHFISFSEFIPANVIIFLQIISQDHDVFLYVNDKDLENYKPAETDRLKVFDYNQAEKLNLIQRKVNG